MTVSVRKVSGRKMLKEFIVFPERLYKGNKLWVPALMSDELFTLNKKKNPAFKYCEADYFLAERDGKTVGRIAAIINHNANRDWNTKSVRFGWVDFIDDYEVSKALFDAVRQWGEERGMDEMRGPLGFTDMDKEGLLIDGFDKYPSITTIWNYPYYLDHFSRYGLEKDVDWIQNEFPTPKQVPDKLHKFANVVMERYGLKIYRPKSIKDLKKRGIEIFSVYNEAYSSLYEFTRVSDEQIQCYVNQYLPIVNKDFICLIADKDDKIVGFAITMPCLSEAMIKAKGRYLPFGFWHLLRALKRVRTLELYLIGVLPQYKHKGLNAIIFDYLHSNAIKYKVEKVVTNPQLEYNTAVLSLFDEYPIIPYQKRRAYRYKF